MPTKLYQQFQAINLNRLLKHECKKNIRMKTGGKKDTNNINADKFQELQKPCPASCTFCRAHTHTRDYANCSSINVHSSLSERSWWFLLSFVYFGPGSRLQHLTCLSVSPCVGPDAVIDREAPFSADKEQVLSQVGHGTTTGGLNWSGRMQIYQRDLKLPRRI